MKDDLKKKENGAAGDFKMYKGIVHLKYTGIELITDILAISEETRSVLVKNPCILQPMATEDGKSQMALVPFLMTSKDDTVHLALGDILFISECREDVAEQHTQMFSSIMMPKKGGKIII
tara:strand:+ start:51 stop:410 length:360 start_codon:yes stop_codon:yes gene_type:complete